MNHKIITKLEQLIEDLKHDPDFEDCINWIKCEIERFKGNEPNVKTHGIKWIVWYRNLTGIELKPAIEEMKKRRSEVQDQK